MIKETMSTMKRVGIMRRHKGRYMRAIFEQIGVYEALDDEAICPMCMAAIDVKGEEEGTGFGVLRKCNYCLWNLSEGVSCIGWIRDYFPGQTPYKMVIKAAKDSDEEAKTIIQKRIEMLHGWRQTLLLLTDEQNEQNEHE